VSEAAAHNGLFNILMVGVGGQGIILASDILAMAALYAGHDAKKSEIHGMSQRGGSVFSHIRFGPRVHSPTIPKGKADVLFSLEVMETLRWLEYAGRQTTVISLQTMIKPVGVEDYPEGLEEALRAACPAVRFVDPGKLTGELGDSRVLNVALLGVLSTVVDLPEDCWRRAVEERVPEGFSELNWKAFGVGRKHGIY